MKCQTKIIAHRGYSSLYPENTMHAFKEAVVTGADGIELDVQLSKDGELVIYHDYDISHNTDGKGRIDEYTAAELSAIEVHAGKLDIAGETIPTLRRYFEFIKDKKVFTNIELKNTEVPNSGMEEKLIALIDEFGLRDRVLFSSFNHRSLKKLMSLAPDIGCACLVSAHLEEAGAYAKERGFKWVNPHHSFINEETLAEMNKQEIGCQVWTVNDEDLMEWLFKHNVYAIITDRPELAFAVREGI